MRVLLKRELDSLIFLKNSKKIGEAVVDISDDIDCLERLLNFKNVDDWGQCYFSVKNKFLDKFSRPLDVVNKMLDLGQWPIL